MHAVIVIAIVNSRESRYPVAILDSSSVLGPFSDQPMESSTVLSVTLSVCSLGCPEPSVVIDMSSPAILNNLQVTVIPC